jgi:hypothetical protein
MLFLLFLSLQQFLGLEKGRICTKVETAMHVLWLSTVWSVDSESSPYYISLSTVCPFFTMKSSSDNFICTVSCWGSFMHLLCTNFNIISVLKLIAHFSVLITCTCKALTLCCTKACFETVHWEGHRSHTETFLPSNHPDPFVRVWGQIYDSDTTVSWEKSFFKLLSFNFK